MQENKKPEPISKEQFEWMESQGLSVHATLVPKNNLIDLPGSPAGINTSEVQLFTRISTGEKSKIIQSDFVRNTRKSVKKLIQSQMAMALKELMNQRFGEV